MKPLKHFVLFILSCSVLIDAPAQVPQLISYQGRVLSHGTNFNGSGQFKFALVNSNGTTTFWSNNGSSVGGSEPSAGVTLSVASGLYGVLLGDATLPNMSIVPATVFTNGDVRLRVWFNGGEGSQLMTPDQRIAAVGYAMMAGSVPDGVITGSKLADGAVSASKLAVGVLNPTNFPANSVGSTQLADSISLGTSNSISGQLDIYRTTANTPAISLAGATSRISTYGSDGQEQIRLQGTAWGELFLYDSSVNNNIAAKLSANSSSGGLLNLYGPDGDLRAALTGPNTGGLLSLYNTNGTVRASLSGSSSGALLNLYQADGSIGVQADGDSSGYGLLSVRSTNGSTRALIRGGPASGDFALNNKNGSTSLYLYNYNDLEGAVSVRNNVGNETIYLWGRDSFGNGDGQIGLKKSSGTETVVIQAGEGSGSGAQMLMRNAAGTQTIQLDADASGVQGGYLALYRSNGVASIILDAGQGGEGRVTTQVLQITGGADLSENFDINADKPEMLPGMIVSIDSKNAGELVLCQNAHDKKVAGIVSGAGGVKTGMLMGQAGTKADGRHPVALTGRVYCWVDADAGGAVEAGDLLTTSNTPGHGMKVTNHSLAAGSIIGKAMTSLEKGRGLVLVLVSLQ